MVVATRTRCCMLAEKVPWGFGVAVWSTAQRGRTALTCVMASTPRDRTIPGESTVRCTGVIGESFHYPCELGVLPG